MLYVVAKFFCYFFFVKQKTAYDMRISDWSSDVCSSDLRAWPVAGAADRGQRRRTAVVRGPRRRRCALPDRVAGGGGARLSATSDATRGTPKPVGAASAASFWFAMRRPPKARGCRSEENTSELQSLMRISYAVFCLKTK